MQIRSTRDLVEVYFNGSRVASHKRLQKYSARAIVKPEHMPEPHREYLRYNAEYFREWSKSVGEAAQEVVKYFLTSGHTAEQGYKACVSLTKLEKRYGKKRLEQACARVLTFSSSPPIRTVTSLLHNVKTDKPVAEAESGGQYGITRGAAYWKRGGDGND